MKMSSMKYFLFLIAAGSLLCLIGCSGELSDRVNNAKIDTENLMARVGSEAITRQDLEAALKQIPKRKQEEIIEKVLDDLIENRVFAKEAVRLGLDEDPEVKQALDKEERETLARYFVKKYLDKEAEPSDETIKSFYAEHKDQFIVPQGIKIQHIIVKEEEKAREIEKALNTGESFKTLAKKNSICRCYKKEGLHGWLFKGKIEPELEQILFALEKEKFSTIIKSKEGYQIVKVLDRQDERVIPYEEAQSRIHSRLFWNKKKELIDKYYQAAKVNTHPTGEGVLAQIGDECITEEILAPILAKIPEEKREKAKVRWIDYLIETKVFSREAGKVHLENDPEVAAELRRKKDHVLAGFFRQRYITNRFNINDQHIEEYYQSHLDEYRAPLRVRAKSILVKTRQEAAEILQEVKEGTSFGYLATKKSLYPEASARAGEIGWFGRGEKDPALEKVAFSLERGQISDIIKTEAGYEIIKLMDKKGGEVKPLDEIKQEIKMALLMQRLEEEKKRYYKKAGVKVLGI